MLIFRDQFPHPSRHARPSHFAPEFMVPEEAKFCRIPSYHDPWPHDGDQPQNIWLNAVHRRKQQAVPTGELYAMTNPPLKDRHLIAEHHDVSLCR